jgi:iron(III) transport system ATP-binding protein
MSLVEVSGVSKYSEKDYVVKSVSFVQQPFERIAIMGETGSGKSTLLKMIAGLVQPDAGTILFNGNPVQGPDDKLVPGHPGIAYLSQHFELPKFLRVEQVLSYSNTLSQAEATALYAICQIDNLMSRKTDQLSGGEKQRIALSRLLITSPTLLLLDEPYSNLDIIHKQTLKKVIHDLVETRGLTCMLVSHDPLDTLSWADQLLVLKDGQLVQHGTPQQVYKHPVNEYAAGLTGNFSQLTKRQYAAFAELSPKKLSSKSTYLRPEDFGLSSPGEKTLAGKIKDVQFYGASYDVTVSINGSLILVRDYTGKYKKGDTVGVRLL